MPAQLTTRAQVNGYRFLLRRLDHALIRRDVRMLHDPMRSQFRSLMVGAVLGVLVVAGAAIMAFIRPQGSIGNANIVMGKDSGAIYVVVRDKDDKNKITLYPSLNLASARLLAASNESPTSVKDSKLNSVPRGPIRGIPGVPAALPGSRQGSRSQWTLCDRVPLSASGGSASSTGAETEILAGSLELNDHVKVADQKTAVLAKKTDDQKKDHTYLIYDGKIAEVNPQNDPATQSALAQVLDLSTARPISSNLVGAPVPVPPLVAPTIPHAGENNGPGRLSTVKVGSIIQVAAMDGSGKSDLYVVLDNAIQRVSLFTAQFITYANSKNQSIEGFTNVTPDMIAGIQQKHGNDKSDPGLPVDDFPAVSPKIISASENPVACVTWAKKDGFGKDQSDSTESPSDWATVQLVLGTRYPLSDSQAPVTLATADGSAGDRVDRVFVAPTTGEFVQTTDVKPGSQKRDGLYYIADNGIRYSIPDAKTAAILGLETKPRLAPYSIVGALLPGPTLSVDDAQKSWDTLPPKCDKACG
ncbi:type VII secretion protein EccB [Nocardia yunnanensis]|uniref:Type VII secretion protein EccB n=1 Tax=Nocardia yunnanensis TaxID=2382165 RepID=A0A386ZGK6_9NOCA|nr:type VII secretion protein EccB [Nocardia yunnanensis]AYF76596.1 type VII secretion protein EccB [Nocardia yunnanensis]